MHSTVKDIHLAGKKNQNVYKFDLTGGRPEISLVFQCRVTF